MKRDNIEINQCIVKAFNNCGYNLKNESSIFEFKSFKLHLDGEIEQIEKINENQISTRLRIKIENPVFVKSIYEYVYGWGETEETAMINAFERWIDSDFPVFHDLLADHKLNENYTSEIKLASQSGETGERISWKGIIGPLITLKESNLAIDEENRNEILIILADDITGDFLGNKGVYPIKCFMSKNSENKIEIDCRINGEKWIRGYDTLHAYCQKWNTDNYKIWKQYLIIYSVDEEIKGTLKNKLDEATKEESKTKWWKFWS